MVDRRVRALQEQVERLLPLEVASLAAVVLDLVGQRPGQDSPEPGDQLGLALAREASELAVGLEERLLHQVRRLELDPQCDADQRAGHQPQIVAIQLQQAAERRRVAAAGLGDQLIGDRFARRHRASPCAGALRPSLVGPPS